MIINRSNAFQPLEEPLRPSTNGRVPSGDFIRGNEQRSDMVAEGSFHPFTGLYSQSQRTGNDHDLQWMAGSYQMGKEDVLTYIRDVTLMEETGGTRANVHSTSLSMNGRMVTGDVPHRAYTANANSGKWRYNGSVKPGYKAHGQPKIPPRLAGAAEARRASSPYWSPHPGLYANNQGRGQDQQHIGAVNNNNSHSEEPNNKRIVKQHNTKRGKTWGKQTIYSDGSKLWTPFKQQTSPKINKYADNWTNKMRKRIFFKRLDKLMKELGEEYYESPTTVLPFEETCASSNLFQWQD